MAKQKIKLLKGRRMKKLTELEKLKYWIDAEFTILHVMFGVVILQLTNGLFWNIAIGIYIVFSLVYILTRLAFIAADDPDYLRVPKK